MKGRPGAVSSSVEVDGTAEILWRHTITGDINLWFMNGSVEVSDAWLPRVADLHWRFFGPKQWCQISRIQFLLNPESCESHQWVNSGKDSHLPAASGACQNVDRISDILLGAEQRIRVRS